MLANRISYSMGLTGPSYLLDTACSSSLYALDCAFSAMRNGECDAALVGGSNLILHPYVTLQFARSVLLCTSRLCAILYNSWFFLLSTSADWEYLHQTVIVDHLTLTQPDIRGQKPCALFSCKKPKMQSEFIQRFCTQKPTVMVMLLFIIVILAFGDRYKRNTLQFSV